MSAEKKVEEIYPVRINAYCERLARKSVGVRALYYPDPRELVNPGLSDDGLGELSQMPVPKLIHRYTDRCVLLCTDDCFVHCRFCFRKRQWREGAEKMILSDSELDAVTAYFDRHPEITDVLMSGGDVLTLPDRRVLQIARKLRSAGRISSVRICSRAPAVAPERITEELAEGLSSIDGVWFMTHFDHPDELTDEAHEACRKLVSRGVPVLDQTVLLAGVNDDPETLRTLFKTLVSWRVKPHYLFHVDPVEGVSHFATGVEKGLSILKDFQLSLGSLATPMFAIDLPGGGGKVVLTAADRNGSGEYWSPVLRKYIRHPLA